MPSRPCADADAMSFSTERAVPRGVAKAIQLMRKSLAARLTIDDLATASGLSERSLRRQFRRFTGQSPTAFHRGLRLEAAREALRFNRAGIGVTAAAAEHGFSHFGHFAASYRQRFGEFPSDTRRARSEVAARPEIGIAPARLGVAVLPFGSEGGGPAELALAGAVTDGIAFALGRMRWLDVVDPTPLSGEPLMRACGQARYAVRGRVRRLGALIQVAVRLFEIATGRHIWGNAFEGEGDTRRLLDRTVAEAVSALTIRLCDSEATRAEKIPVRDRTVHDLAMRAFRAASAESASFNARALEDLDRARALDPDEPLALALSAWCHAQRAIYNFARVLEPERDRARRLVARALGRQEADSLTLAVLGNATTMIGDLDQAELLVARCLAIDPHCAMAWRRRGWIACYRGRYTALADFDRSRRLSSADSDRHNCLLGIASAHFGAGRYDQAAEWAMRGLQERPSALWAYRIAAGAQARCGRRDEARHSTTLLLRQYSDLTVSTIVDALPMQEEFLARFAEGLETAGLPVQ